MKNFLISAVFFGLSSISSFAQTYLPDAICQSEPDLKITQVIITEERTRIDFEYLRSKEGGTYIYLTNPNTSSAMYMKTNGVKYKLIDTEGISHKDGITAAYYKNPLTFSAFFEPIPSTVTRFDLIEGSTGSWHFYGIELKENSKTLNEKAKKSRESAFKLLDILLEENDKSGKWDYMYISLVQQSTRKQWSME